MYGSPAPPLPKYLSLPYPSPLPFGGGGGGGGGQRKEEAAASDILRRHQHQQQEQMSSGLLRFRSAPSSLFAEAMEDFLHVRPSSPETNCMLARFLAPPGLRGEFGDKPSTGGCPRNSQFPLAPSSQPAPQMMYHSQQQQQMPNHGAIDGVAYGVVGSMAMENRDQINSDGVVADPSNLIRQSSSPAGILSQLNEENGYDVLNGMGGFRSDNGSIGDVGSRLKGQMSFSSRQNAFMSQISEMRSDGMGGSSPVDRGCAADRSHLPGFPVTSWEHTSSLLSQSSFPGLKRGRGEGEGKLMVDPSEAQNAGPGNPVAGLAHQFSLPEKTSSEKFLQFQDTVPCKFRAKRGCATHPRSVAERMRRTKISERMRKLQELVPNMDKQTTTSDMLDLAVDYIKDLQTQVEALMERRANCTCPAGNNKHKS